MLTLPEPVLNYLLKTTFADRNPAYFCVSQEGQLKQWGGAIDCKMPVVELSIRYHRAMRLGMQGIVKARMMQIQGVRIPWDYQIQSLDAQELYVTAQVTLVAIDREKGRIMRQLPAALEAALTQMGRSI